MVLELRPDSWISGSVAEKPQDLSYSFQLKLIAPALQRIQLQCIEARIPCGRMHLHTIHPRTCRSGERSISFEMRLNSYQQFPLRIAFILTREMQIDNDTAPGRSRRPNGASP